MHTFWTAISAKEKLKDFFFGWVVFTADDVTTVQYENLIGQKNVFRRAKTLNAQNGQAKIKNWWQMTNTQCDLRGHNDHQQWTVRSISMTACQFKTTKQKQNNASFRHGNKRFNTSLSNIIRKHKDDKTPSTLTWRIIKLALPHYKKHRQMILSIETLCQLDGKHSQLNLRVKVI